MIVVKVGFSSFRTKSRKNNRRQFYESVACILNKICITDYLIYILAVFVPWLGICDHTSVLLRGGRWGRVGAGVLFHLATEYPLIKNIFYLCTLICHETVDQMDM